MGVEISPFRCMPRDGSAEQLVADQEQKPVEVPVADGDKEETEVPPRAEDAPAIPVTPEPVAPLLSRDSESNQEEDNDEVKEPMIGDQDATPVGSEKLYERDEQQRVLLAGYHRARARLLGIKERQIQQEQQQQEEEKEPIEVANNDPAQLFLINAASGMGKTALATSIRHQVSADGGFFVSGKFAHSLVVAQKQHQRKPLAPFVAALNEWVDQLWKDPKHDAVYDQLQSRIRREDLSAEFQSLLEEVPALRTLIHPIERYVESSFDADNSQGNSSHNNSSRGSRNRRPSIGGGSSAPTHQAQTQFAVVLGRFLRLICSLDRPCVLLLDDLQWADSASLELLESLSDPSAVKANNYPGLMVIATCRSNEVKFRHPLSEMLRRVEDNGTSIIDVQPRNLGLSALSQMISDALGLPVEECRGTAEMVLKETNGNALFSRQYIQSLHQGCYDGIQDTDGIKDTNGDEDDPSEDGSGDAGFRWQSEVESLGGISQVESLASLSQSEDEHFVRWLARQMRGLPVDARYLLQVISCLGGTFDINILQRSSCLAWDTLHHGLMICVDWHFITYDSDTKAGCFAHDKYQEAAYNLVSVGKRERFMLRLGRNLQEQCQDTTDSEEYLVLVVDLLLHGKNQITNEDDREKLALWCLEAGRFVAGASYFAGSHALDYLEHGIGLLSRRHWRDHYDLSLALYNTAAELAYGQGNHARVAELVNAIKLNARSFMDTVQAVSLSIYSIGAKGDFDDAIAVAYELLADLGHPMPESMTDFGSRQEMSRTSRMLKRLSDRYILDLPRMDDRKAMATMTVIQMMHPFFATVNPKNAVLTGSRLVRLTLKYGFSPISTIGFSMYALQLARMGNVQEGHRYGQLCLQLMEKHPCIECESKVFLSLGIGPVFAKKTPQEALDLMERSHSRGLQTGDLETAMRAHLCASVTALTTGTPLPKVAEKLNEGIRFCEDYSSEFTKHLAMPYEKIIQLLINGKDGGSGGDSVKQFCLEAKHESIRVYKILGYCFFAMFMDQLSFAQQLIGCLKGHKVLIKSLLPASQVCQVFVEGMIAAALGRKNKDRSMLRKARRRLTKLRKLKVHNPDFFRNKICLVRAELEASAGRKHSALSSYDEAIELAANQGFIHEQALACEKAGRMLLDWERKSEGVEYLSQAHALYNQWGATAKLSQIARLLKHGSSNFTRHSVRSSNITRSDGQGSAFS